MSSLNSVDVLETFIDGIVICERDGTILSFNRSAEIIFGYKKSEVLGAHFALLLPPQFRDEHEEYVYNLFNVDCTKKRPVIGPPRELYGLRKSGEVFPLEMSISELSSSSSPQSMPTELRYVATLRDITHRKKREEESQRKFYVSRYLKDFEELECLGRGGFGSVYRVRNRLDGIEYACKKIKLKDDSSWDWYSVTTSSTPQSPAPSSFSPPTMKVGSYEFDKMYSRSVTDVNKRSSLGIMSSSYHSLNHARGGAGPNAARNSSPPQQSSPFGLRDHKFLREVTTMARMKHHDNIIRYYNSWVEKVPISEEFESIYADFIRKNNASDSFTQTITDEESEDYDPFDRTNGSNSHDYSDNSDKHQIEDDDDDDDDDGIDHGGDSLDDFDSDANFFFAPSKQRNRKHSSESPAIGKSGSKKHDKGSNSSSSSSSSNNKKKKNGAEKQEKSHMRILFIQMELCKCQTLKQWLETESRVIDRTLNLRIFEQIVRGIEFIHKEGYIHRDIKPSNIFVECGSDVRVKIGDFGLSKQNFLVPISKSIEDFSAFSPEDDNDECGPEEHADDPTLGVGTQIYAGPEQFLPTNNGRYNEKVDIFPLGIILFEMFHKFSTNMERIKVLTDLKNGQPTREMKEKYPDVLKLVMHLLSVDPQNRPSAKEILAYDIIREISARHHNRTPSSAARLEYIKVPPNTHGGVQVLGTFNITATTTTNNNNNNGSNNSKSNFARSSSITGGLSMLLNSSCSVCKSKDAQVSELEARLKEKESMIEALQRELRAAQQKLQQLEQQQQQQQQQQASSHQTPPPPPPFSSQLLPQQQQGQSQQPHVPIASSSSSVVVVAASSSPRAVVRQPSASRSILSWK